MFTRHNQKVDFTILYMKVSLLVFSLLNNLISKTTYFHSSYFSKYSNTIILINRKKLKAYYRVGNNDLYYGAGPNWATNPPKVN